MDLIVGLVLTLPPFGAMASGAYSLYVQQPHMMTEEKSRNYLLKGGS